MKLCYCDEVLNRYCRKSLQFQRLQWFSFDSINIIFHYLQEVLEYFEYSIYFNIKSIFASKLSLLKIKVIRRNQVYFSSSNVQTDITAIIKDQMFNKTFTLAFKITIKWNLKKSHAARLKSAKYKAHVIKENL